MITDRDRIARCMLFVVVICAAGCACDIDAWAADRAGDDYVDCGRGVLGELEDPMHQCAVDAFRRGEAFAAVIPRQGFDSEVAVAYAGDAEGRVWIAQYDGDTSGGDGGGSQISERECIGPGVGLVGAGGAVPGVLSADQERLLCTAQGPYVIDCD